MAYTPWSVVVGEQPTTTKWNLLGGNDASFHDGTGINDQAIVWRHLQTDMIPTGVVWQWTGNSAPSSNWLICDGSAVSRTTYAALYAVIGVTFGAGDGTTTFNLPDYRGRVPVGKNGGTFTSIGTTGGEEQHTLSWNEMPVHNHGVNDPGHNHGISWVGTSVSGYGWVDGPHQRSSGFAYTGGSGTGISIQNAGSGWSHNNIQPFITINFIIKT